jgi:hypothetical protein
MMIGVFVNLAAMDVVARPISRASRTSQRIPWTSRMDVGVRGLLVQRLSSEG